jgi:GNAT superfamily N-acetyltransferase
MTKANASALLESVKAGPVLIDRSACCSGKSNCCTPRPRCAFVIRPYRAADFKDLLALWKAGDISLDESDTARAYAENFKKRKDGWQIFVAEARWLNPVTRRPAGKARVAGGVILTFDGHRSYVYHFVVHADFRGLGLGRALLETCEQQAELWGARHLRLTARTDAARAVAHQLYESAGWNADRSLWVFKKDLAGVKTSTQRRPSSGSTC